MLGRLLNTRLRAAETALRQGRLDEAYRIATAPDLREHRHAAVLLRQLAEKLIERAREHFAADRFREALRDLDWAQCGGVMQDRINELREQINTVSAEAARQERSRQERLAQAQRRLAAGSLDAGRRILDAAGQEDAEAANMKRDLDMRDNEAAELFAQVERLIREEQWVAAVERFSKGAALDPHDPACPKLEAGLCKHFLENARRFFQDGRVERAAEELACLRGLGRALPDRRELEDLVWLVRQAGQALRNGEYDAALQNVLRLRHLAPDLRWISEVVEQLGAVDKMLTSLRTGPLGAFEHAAPAPAPPRPAGAPQPPLSLAETVAFAPMPQRSALPDRVLLLVDGGGSFLLLRKDRVSIGRAATSNPADIAVFADLDDRHADIARVEDDYFLFSAHEVEVSGRQTRQQLLQDGDRLVLGPKAKCTFRLPSRKSPSATLDLSDTSKMAHDVRRVVLFAQNAMVGCGPGFHVPCQVAREPLVLFERGGTLWVRPARRGPVATHSVPLEMGKTVEIEGVSMTAKPWPK